MLKFEFGRKQRPLKILCFGAHSDDIEIGCGGTILRLLNEYEDVEVVWVVLGSSGQRDREAVESANKFLENAQKKEIIIQHFRDGFFPYVGGEIKDFFENLKKRVSPDIIFTHYRQDLHQDHRLVSELTWNTFRNHFILEYEIMKYDGDIGNPNFFFHLNEGTCLAKVAHLLEFFKTQRENDWFTANAFLALLRLRGIECKAPGNYAEGFYCRKALI